MDRLDKLLSQSGERTRSEARKLIRGGTVQVKGAVEDGVIELLIENPIAPATVAQPRSGNRIALDNVRQRLALAYGSVGSVRIEQADGRFKVILRFPSVLPT